MGPEALCVASVAGQLLWALGRRRRRLILPGRSARRPPRARPRSPRAGRVALALLGFLALSNGVHGAIVWLGLLEGTTLAEIDRVVRETSPAHPALGLARDRARAGARRGAAVPRLPAALARDSRSPGRAAVLGSAALFGVAHLDPVHGVAAFLLGAYLGAVAWRARSLRARDALPRRQQHARAARAPRACSPSSAHARDPWRVVLALALAAALPRPRARAAAFSPARRLPMSRGPAGAA